MTKLLVLQTSRMILDNGGKHARQWQVSNVLFMAQQSVKENPCGCNPCSPAHFHIFSVFGSLEICKTLFYVSYLYPLCIAFPSFSSLSLQWREWRWWRSRNVAVTSRSCGRKWPPGTTGQWPHCFFWRCWNAIFELSLFNYQEISVALCKWF